MALGALAGSDGFPKVPREVGRRVREWRPLPDLVLPLPGAASRIRAVQVENGRVFVLAGVVGPIVVFGSAGLAEARIGTDLAQRAEFSPIDFAVIDDTVFVAESNAPGVLSRYLIDGARIPSLAIENDAALAAIDVSRSTIAVATFRMNPLAPIELVKILDRRGRRLQVGCPQDARVGKSIAAAGMLARFQTTTVAIQDSVIWCSQPTAPKLVFTTEAGAVGEERTVPYFYRGPIDRPLERNAKRTVEYLGSWTALRGVIARGGVRVSGYSMYLVAERRFQYWAVTCVGPAVLATCAAQVIDGWPAAIDAKRHLYAVPDSQPPNGVRLLRYSLYKPSTARRNSI